MKFKSENTKGILIAFLGALLLTPDTLFMRLSEMDVWTMLFWRGFQMGAILILNEMIDKSIKKLYVGNENVFKSLDLSEFIDNQTQVMIKQSDRIYKLIIDPNVEIFIR